MAIVYPQFILIWFYENQLQWLVLPKNVFYHCKLIKLHCNNKSN